MLVLEWSTYTAMLAHATEDEPREACGVLVGESTGETTRVEAAMRMENVATSPRVSYRIDPAALLSVFDEAAAVGRSVVGFYHSHPAGPPTPSSRDVTTASWPGYHYCVVSLAGGWPTVDAWVWTGDEFDGVAVTVAGADED